LLSLSAPWACDSEHHEEESEAAHACIHLENGPGVTVVASADRGGPPDISVEHTRYDVTLAASGDSCGGRVEFASGQAGHYVVFLTRDIPLAVEDAFGAPLTPLHAGGASPDCGLVAAHCQYELGIGTYTFILGPSADCTVSLVVEGSDHEHEH